MIQIKDKQSATYFNKNWNTWGFFNCEADIYATQDEAYAAYLESVKQ